MERTLSYFVSDVHLGLQVLDPKEREQRFVDFLNSIPKDRAEALYMLGDIWDFWYEWKYTIPKGYLRVFAALDALMAAGVKVYFFQGNHDVWTYRYFEELGMIRLTQPAFVEIGDKTFCLGHGDALAKTGLSYRIMRAIFHNGLCQRLFSCLLHPTIAMAIGNAWSRNNRLSRREAYSWKGVDEPMVAYCEAILKQRKVDYFVFGHFHVEARETLSTGAQLVMLDSWIFKSNYFVYQVPRNASEN